MTDRALDELSRAGQIAYREAGPADGPAVLLVHGYPASSYMWRETMSELAAGGYRAIAPDLPGFGDSEPDPPGTWERHVEALERLRLAVAGAAPLALVLHDWGVMIGLRWACDHPEAVSALVISDGGFFADRRWHDLAEAMRTEGEGERLIDGFTRPAFGNLMRAASARITDAAIDEYWKAFADPARRRSQLELYRSGDFEKLVPYEGCVAALGVPALILWGELDRFASVRMAHRFHAEIPGSRLELLPSAGHFVFEDEPHASAAAVARFIASV